MKSLPIKVLTFSLILCLLLAGCPAAQAESYLWPVPDSRTITQGYKSSHPALDIGGSAGIAIVATKGGTVVQVYTGCNNYSRGKTCSSSCSPNVGVDSKNYSPGLCNYGYGNGVVVKHSDGTYACYAHMQNNILVSKNQTVSQGTILGYMGSSGNSTGAHLHFEVIDGHASAQGTYYGHSDTRGISGLNISEFTYTAGGTPAACSCTTEVAGWYQVTAADGLNLNSGHNYNSAIVTMPANAWVWVSKKSPSSTHTHVSWNGYEGIASFNYLKKATSHTLTFNDNGGSGGQGTLTVWKSVPNVSSAAKVKIPVRDNYTFQGYYINSTQMFDATGANTYTSAYWSGKAWNGSGSLTLTAQWKINTIFVTDVSISQTSAALTEGDTLTLQASVLPANATYQNVTWSSSNPSVATVNANGTVTAIAPGTAVITAASQDGTNKSASCSVQVQHRITGLTFNRNTELLSLEAPFNRTRIYATLEPNVDVPILWQSSDPSVAVVSDDGIVTAVGEGTAHIAASVPNGPSDESIVRVTGTLDTFVLPGALSSIDAQAFEGVQAQAVIIPKGVETIGEKAFANISGLRFVFLPNSVQTLAADAFDGNSALTIVWGKNETFTSNGKLIPTIYDADAAFIPVQRLSMAQSLTLSQDSRQALSVTFYPANASNQALEWESSNPSVAMVDNNGQITCTDIGTTVITARALDGSGVSCSCTVTVTVPNVTVTVENETFSVADNAAYAAASLTVGNVPELGSVSMIGFELYSSDHQPLGHYMMTAAGASHYTCSFDLGSMAGVPLDAATTYYVRYLAVVSGYTFYSDYSSFTTAQPIPRLVLSASSLRMVQGETATLTAEILHHDADDILWRSSNSGVVYVLNGTLTAQGTGTATITARLANDTSIQATCTVTVTAAE